jgi:hypothetical protein
MIEELAQRSGKPSLAKARRKLLPPELPAPQFVTGPLSPLRLWLPIHTDLRGCSREARPHPGTFSFERHIRGKWV